MKKNYNKFVENKFYTYTIWKKKKTAKCPDRIKLTSFQYWGKKQQNFTNLYGECNFYQIVVMNK